MHEHEIRCCLSLLDLPGAGAGTVLRLIEAAGSATAVLDLSPARLQALAGGEHPGAGAGAGAALLEQTVRFHVTSERAVGRHRLFGTQGRAQVVVMQLS
mgnify:CR=1 FL=1